MCHFLRRRPRRRVLSLMTCPRTSLSIDVDVVSFDVVVTDQSGNPIAGLEKHHFRVFDDDVEQTVTNFSPTDAPLTTVILAEFSNPICGV